MRQVTAFAQEGFDGIDILVNNAGTSQRGDFLDIGDTLWQEDLISIYSPLFAYQGGNSGMQADNGAGSPCARFGCQGTGRQGAPTAISRAAGVALVKVLASENAAITCWLAFWSGGLRANNGNADTPQTPSIVMKTGMQRRLKS